MVRQYIPRFTAPFIVSLLFCNTVGQECGIDSYSSYQKMLQGHTFKTFQARPLSFDCREACNADVRCQSFNYVMFNHICELNNRTKEARPEDFVINSDRYYMEKAPNRVVLGSIQELPADSCTEIKASEGARAISGNYWLDPTRTGQSILTHCDMTTEQCRKALGMESGAITDGQINASSQYSIYTAPARARLKGQKNTSVNGGAWSPATSDVNQWLQIDLGSTDITVTRVATQGRNGHSKQCVDKYKLQYSDDEVNFQYYKEQGRAIAKNFDGNTDRDTIVYQDLSPPIRACYIRFRPMSWIHFIAMRVELYGCQV